LAPLLLALCRFGQGLGLGGEWGGAVLLATENAPPRQRALYGMFPQFGTPLGLWCSTGVFLWLTYYLSEADLLAWGWRMPFIASALLVFVGLYVRLRLEETPDFRRVIQQGERVRVPLVAVCVHNWRELLIGVFVAVPTFVVFYLTAVFALSWGTAVLGYARSEFLVLQMIAVLFLTTTIPLSAILANRHGSRPLLMLSTVSVMVFGLLFAPLFRSGSTLGLLTFLSAGFAVVGLTWGPLGTALSDLFPASVRYTGASLSFNVAGILGASLAPYLATWLATRYGLAYVGYYMAFAGLVGLVALSMLSSDSSSSRAGRSPRS
jgi:MFS family permease